MKRFLIFLIPFILFPSMRGYTEEVYRLDEIVVSSTKAPEERAEIPNAIVLKKSEDVETSGAKTIGELLANEPGIDWLTYGDYGGASQSLWIRGVRADGTQVFLNGVNVNSPSLGEADLSKIPLENIEKIEVVKGSGSLLYGSGAIGGIVNIFTKEPKKDKVDLKLKAGYGTEKTYRLSFEHGRFLKGPFGYYITAGRTETDGFRENGDLRQNDASLKLLLDKGDPMRLSLYGDYVEASYGVPGVKPPKGTEEFVRNGIAFYNDESASLVNHGKDKNGNLVLEAKGKPGERLTYNLKGFHRYMNNYYYQRYASLGTGGETWVINTVDGIEGNANIYPFEKARFLLGAEYKEFGWKNDSFDLDANGRRTTRQRIKANIYTKALFAEGELRPVDALKLIAGIRREDHSTFGEEYVPRFGVVLLPSDKISIKLTHGRHFRAPTPNDLFWPESMYEKGNPDLKPEVGWHTDLTYEHLLLSGKAFFSLSLFRWRVDRKIEWEPDANGVWCPTNLKDYGADGLEAGLRVSPLDNLELSFSYTYIDAYEKAREYTVQDYGWPPLIPPNFQYSIVKRQATLVPKNHLKVGIDYMAPFSIKTKLTLRYVDERVGTYRTEYTVYPNTKTVKYTIGSYWTLDLRLERLIKEHFKLAFDARNIFDEEYATRLGTFYDKTGKGTVCPYPAPGRSFFLSLSYEF